MDNDEHDSSRLHIIGRIIGVAIVIGAVAASIYAFRRELREVRAPMMLRSAPTSSASRRR